MSNVKELVALLHDNKMKNITIYDLSTEAEEKYVVMATSGSILASKKAADAVSARYDYTNKIEGYNKGEWIVFDFVGVTLHIFLTKIRDKYNLDKLYKPKKINLK